jgi:hypothetical protein
MDKRDFLFKFLPKTLRSQLKLDDEALYSVTDQQTADKITMELLKFVPANAIVTDGTACIGGNTFSLARSFRFVNAVELEPNRYDYLKHNMSVLGVDNVACYKGDVMNYVAVLEQSLLFLDPPWGGPDYKSKDSVDLSLSGFPLDDVCRQFAPYTSYIALKTPTNFHLQPFVEQTKEYMTLVYTNTKLRKLCLSIFKTGE